jgi:hypothetical protein
LSQGFFMKMLRSFVLAVFACLNLGLSAPRSIYDYDVEELTAFQTYFEGLARKIIPVSPYVQTSALCTPAKKQGGRRLSFDASSPDVPFGCMRDSFFSPVSLPGHTSPMSLARSVSPVSSISSASTSDMTVDGESAGEPVLFGEDAIRAVLKCLKLAIKLRESKVVSPPRPGFGERSSSGSAFRAHGKAKASAYCDEVAAAYAVYSEIRGATTTIKANLEESIELALSHAFAAGFDVELALEVAAERDDSLYCSRFE